MSPMTHKSMLKSRTVHVLAAMAVLLLSRYLARFLPADMALEVAKVLTDEVLGAVGVPLLLVGIHARHRATRPQAGLRTAGDMLAAQRPKPRRTDAGFATVRGMVLLGAAGGALGLVLWPILLLCGGCASAWPQACTPGPDGMACRCSELAFTVDPHPAGAPAPAGRVGLRCDGQRLPVHADGDNVRLP